MVYCYIYIYLSSYVSDTCCAKRGVPRIFEAAEAEFQDLKQELRQQQEASGSCEIPYLGELVWYMQSQLLWMNHSFFFLKQFLAHSRFLSFSSIFFNTCVHNNSLRATAGKEWNTFNSRLSRGGQHCGTR